jgi:hypothetical protein
MLVPPRSKAEPKVSIIVIYEGAYRAYLPNMFASFLANDPLMELIWVDIGKNEEEHRDCLDVSQWVGEPGTSNIKTICLSRYECEESIE